ncbi:MAG: hypothetical protein ABIY47_12190 [Opitutaceae bacterium]
MNIAPDDAAFLRDLVKISRQKTQHVKWVDRDGSDRNTALTREEASRVGSLAKRAGISPGEVLRRAAHVPLAAAKAPAVEG